jgi:hypothetical protein
VALAVPRESGRFSGADNKYSGESNIVTILLTTKGFVFGGFPFVHGIGAINTKAIIPERGLFSVCNPHNLVEKKFRSQIRPLRFAAGLRMA